MSFVRTYKTLPITIVRGEGCFVWDTAGTKYLDMYAGHAVASTGHSHPHVVSAIAGQAQNLIFYSTMVDVAIRHEAAAKLIAHAPAPLTSVLFANSGAEANENALKMAILQTGRKKIVTFAGGFHGRTLLAMNVTANPKYHKQLPYVIPDIEVCPFGDLAAIRKAIDSDTAAVILEPVQSMAGCRTASPEFFQELRALTSQHGAYLIFDEVQTGIGRTGKMFFSGHFDVVPDIVTLAKGIASGVPLSAVLVSQTVADRVQYGEFGATYGAGPLAMAAMKATIEVIEQEQLLDRVTKVSTYLRHLLDQLPEVIEILGLGLLIGVKTSLPAAELQARLLKQGVIVGTSDDPHIIRLLPPLTLTQVEVDIFLKAFSSVFYRSAVSSQ